MYDSFESLPEDIQGQIRTLIEPSDPEAWVKSPIQDLGGRSFLETINADDGEQEINRYLERVEAFEQLPGQTGPEDLGKVLHFGQADLDANRAGLLSAAQRQRLVRGDVLEGLAAAVCLVAGAIFNVALLAGWMTAHGRGAALGVTLMVIGVLLGVWSWETWLDLATGNVLVAEGPLRATERVVTGRSGPRTIYSFEVGGQTFDVPKAAHDEVHEGNRRLYYLRHTRTVLSVDSIRN